MAWRTIVVFSRVSSMKVSKHSRNKATTPAGTGHPPLAAESVYAKTVKRIKPFKIATWNVRTLLQPGSPELLAETLNQHNVEIACLQETRIPHEGSLNLEIPENNTLKKAYKLYFAGQRITLAYTVSL